MMLAMVAGMVASFKGRSGTLWGFLTLVQPWVILIVFMLPRKLPKFRSYLKDEPAFRDVNPVIASIMALSAVVAKADGHVSREEVEIIRRYITQNFRISGSELSNYQAAFDYGKNHPEEYKEFVRVIRTYHNNRNFVLSLSYLLLTIGVQDKTLSSDEETSIKRIVLEMGLTEYEYISIKNHFTGAGRQYGNGFGGFGNRAFGSGSYGYGSYGTGNGASFGGVSTASLVEKYSKVLDVDKNSSLNDVKKAYRRKAKEYHPDRMAADGMPLSTRSTLRNVSLRSMKPMSI